MGIDAAIAIVGLLGSLGGGVWASFTALNGHLVKIEASLELVRWRLQRIESEMLGEQDEQ
ncbi:MAG: hypothetical protein HC857_11920 [Synechococcales cyanobacterium RU_4_20]|nr:hypothetical protein [Synechococcales cyanobacterium RU_4_20]NJR70519.1 hypothetical protein [Synechococcales cyanobacterium CRU_2_2]